MVMVDGEEEWERGRGVLMDGCIVSRSFQRALACKDWRGGRALMVLVLVDSG